MLRSSIVLAVSAAARAQPSPPSSPPVTDGNALVDPAARVAVLTGMVILLVIACIVLVVCYWLGKRSEEKAQAARKTDETDGVEAEVESDISGKGSAYTSDFVSSQLEEAHVSPVLEDDVVMPPLQVIEVAAAALEDGDDAAPAHEDSADEYPVYAMVERAASFVSDGLFAGGLSFATVAAGSTGAGAVHAAMASEAFATPADAEDSADDDIEGQVDSEAGSMAGEASALSDIEGQVGSEAGSMAGEASALSASRSVRIKKRPPLTPSRFRASQRGGLPVQDEQSVQGNSAAALSDTCVRVQFENEKQTVQPVKTSPKKSKFFFGRDK